MMAPRVLLHSLSAEGVYKTMMKLLSLAVMFPVLLCGQGPLPADYPVSAGDETNAEAPSPAAATTPPLPALTVRQKVNRRAWRLIEPVTLIDSAFGAGIEQWRDVRLNGDTAWKDMRSALDRPKVSRLRIMESRWVSMLLFTSIHVIDGCRTGPSNSGCGMR